MGIMAAGQQAAMGKYLAFSRNQESSADLAGARYLSKAAVSGKGSIAFFKKLQNQEFRLEIPQTDSYASKHPQTEESIVVLKEVYQNNPAWKEPIAQKMAARFERVKARIVCFVSEQRQKLRLYHESDMSIPSHK